MLFIHLTPLDPDWWGERERGEGRDIFSLSLESQNVWAGLLSDKRDFKSEACVPVTGVSVKKTQRPELRV